MEKLTVPGVAEVAVPLGVFTLSHGAPGSTAAVQFTAAFAGTVTRNDPSVFPGALPVADWNCVPAGARVMIGFPEISKETGTVTGPAVESKVM
jgi:hypothetical protein